MFQDNDGSSVVLSGDLTDIVISGNTACRSGEFRVLPGFDDRLDAQGYSC
ncbi:hypothetical protein [uncultured Arthrobacter sp.]|nr:hypothetical protein [uncultured Arthrobacter sp.]